MIQMNVFKKLSLINNIIEFMVKFKDVDKLIIMWKWLTTNDELTMNDKFTTCENNGFDWLTTIEKPC
jgi:hypothetical protein